jgi:hypothetical protein
MDNGKIVHRGEMAATGGDVALQERLLGLEPGDASMTDLAASGALPKPKRGCSSRCCCR